MNNYKWRSARPIQMYWIRNNMADTPEEKPGLIDLYGMYSEEPEIKAPAKSYQQLAGLKLSGAHEHTLNLGEKTIHVANVNYVKLLEKQVQELRAEIRSLQSYTRRLANHYNKLVKGVEDIERDITRKFGNNVDEF